MRFIKLAIENYKSFQFPTEIYFPENIDGNSIFLIGGMNGAGKTAILEAINYCLFGAKTDLIYRNINRKEKALGNANVSFELTIELDDHSELLIKRSWSAGVVSDPLPKDLVERLVVVQDGKRVSVQNKQMWQDYIRATIPPSITQFFFFDGEKIQEIAADEHSEVRLKSSLEAALGIEYITKLSRDILYIKQDERKSFVQISDEDLDFKESELKREKSKLARNNKERDELNMELESFKDQYSEAKKRFQITFNAEPETRETLRENEKNRLKYSNRLGQVENEIKSLSDNYLPFSILGNLYDSLRNQIENERESSQIEAIRDHAAELSKKIVRVVEEPEPIFKEKLTKEKTAELERRIYRLLKEGYSLSDTRKILNLSDRDAARILQKMESLENSEVFLISPLLEEKRELNSKIRQIEISFQGGVATESEQELFDQLQEEIESCSIQIGRKSEQIRMLEDDILGIEKSIRDIEIEIEKLYEKHNVSKEKTELIEECDAIANLLNKFVVRLRKNKVQLLQEKTFEMYQLLSSRSDLIKDITIDEKTYEIRIIGRSGNSINKSGLSAGEKEIFAISLLWGLAQTSQLKLPIIIDTPLSRLDSTHRDNIVSHYFTNAGDQVIILSTDTEVDNEYYRLLKPHLSGAARLEFDKRQEISSIESGYFWEN